MEAASAIVGGCIVVFVGKRYCCIVVKLFVVLGMQNLL